MSAFEYFSSNFSNLYKSLLLYILILNRILVRKFYTYSKHNFETSDIKRAFLSLTAARLLINAQIQSSFWPIL